MFGRKTLMLVALAAFALLALPWGSAQARPYYYRGYYRPYYRPYFYGPRIGVGLYVAPPPVVVAPAPVVVPAPAPVYVAPAAPPAAPVYVAPPPPAPAR